MLSTAGEHLLVLAIDRWHPAAKIAEEASRPDLLEAAIAINGAASTATYILHYGPVAVTEETPGERKLFSLNRQDLAPWPLLRPLLRRTSEQQERAVRYLWERSRGRSDEDADIDPDLEALGERWEAFEQMMWRFQIGMHMPDAERVDVVEPTVQGLLTVVGVEIKRALRADFLNRFAMIVHEDPDVIERAMHDDGSGQEPRRYTAQVDGRKAVIAVRSPPVIAMLDSLYAPASAPPSLKDQGLRVAIGAKTLLTVGITATPEFAIKNALRDMLAAFVLGKKWQAPWHMLASTTDEARQSEIAQEWLLHGGSFCAFYDTAPMSTRQDRKRS